MSKLLEIKISKATLFLTEKELLEYLPPDVVAESLQRGKAILRQRKQQKREQEKIKGGNYFEGNQNNRFLS
jgi:hypothetical protein